MVPFSNFSGTEGHSTDLRCCAPCNWVFLFFFFFLLLKLPLSIPAFPGKFLPRWHHIRTFSSVAMAMLGVHSWCLLARSTYSDRIKMTCILILLPTPEICKPLEGQRLWLVCVSVPDPALSRLLGAVYLVHLIHSHLDEHKNVGFSLGSRQWLLCSLPLLRFLELYAINYCICKWSILWTFTCVCHLENCLIVFPFTVFLPKSLWKAACLLTE